MTGEELIQEVRDIIDEPSTAVVSDSDIVRKANLALKQLKSFVVSSGSGWYDKDTTIATSSGTSEYSLPTDFSQLRAFKIQTDFSFSPTIYYVPQSIVLKPFSFTTGYSESTQGMPTMYQIRKDVVKFYPIPDTEYAIYLYYVRKPTEIDADDLTLDIDIPYEATPLLVLSTAINVAIEAGYDTTELQFAYKHAERMTHASIQDRNSGGILRYKRRF